MIEYLQGFQGTVSFFIPLGLSLLWWLGGRAGGRSIRRWLAPLFFSVSLCLYAAWLGHFVWWYVFSFGLYKLASHIGYGADNLDEKLLKRAVWSFIQSGCALIFVAHSGEWLIWSIQAIVSLFISIGFGSFNPFDSAAKEEMVICFGSSFLVPFMV